MTFIELALRTYAVVSALPVLGFLIILLLDVSAANKPQRQVLQHSDPVL
jgi:hypothetical protein